MIHLDVRVEIDQVQLRLPAGHCGSEIGGGTVVAHSVRGDGARALAEPSQLSRIWPEQCRGAQQQRGFSGGRMADDRHGLGQPDLEVDSAKHLGRREACADADAKAFPE